MSDQRKSNRPHAEQRYSSSREGGFGLPFWGDAAPYCKGYFFFFIILSGFGENLLSHLSSTAVAGFAAVSADETKPEKHQR